MPLRQRQTHQIEVTKEDADGRSVVRRGGDEADTDFDIGTKSSPTDLASSKYESSSRNIGGAEVVSGHINTQDSETFSVFIDWLDDSDNVLITKNPTALTNVSDEVEFALRVRSDRMKLRVEDTSGAANNRVNGTVNAH